MIFINLASRSRPERFFNALCSIYNNAEKIQDIIIYCSLDIEDISMNNKFVKEKIGIFNNHYKNMIIDWGESLNKIHAINRFWNKKNTALIDNTNILINFSDDMNFLIKGFDSIILKDMQNYFPDFDGVLHYPDGNRIDIMTMSILGIKYFMRDRYIYHPSYIGQFCDEEAQEVAKQRKRYKFVNKNIFVHLHKNYGHCKTDEQYQKYDCLFEKDKQNFLERKAKNFSR